MTLKKNRSVIMISILSFIIFIISIFLTSQGNYANEKEKLEKVSMYLYDLEVETPLILISNFLGQRPVDSVNWNEQMTQELNSLFDNLSNGISNINNPEVQVVPDKTLLHLQTLQENINSILESISSETALKEEAKEEIMAVSSSVHACELGKLNRNWEQIETEVECLNKAIDASRNEL